MRGTSKDIARAITRWRPDLVWCHHGRAASAGDFLSELSRNGIPTAVYLCDEPYEIGETAKYSPKFRFVFSMDPTTVEAHRNSRSDRRGVFYLPACADTSRFVYRNYSKRTTPAFFLGNANLIPRPDYLLPTKKQVEGADIRFFKPPRKGTPKWVSLDQHPELYSSCLVGLNVHRAPWMDRGCWSTRVNGRDPKRSPVPKGLKLPTTPPKMWGTGFWNDANLDAEHVNPRFFEMGACGTLVVSDNQRSEMARMFPYMPQAQNPAHFVELVQYYIDHPDEAEALGHHCSTQISLRHDYKHRAAEVLIRAGLKDPVPGALPSYLGEPEDWMTPQDSEQLKGRLSSDPTGPCGRWSPAYGMSSIKGSGNPSEATSLRPPTPW